MFFKNIDDLKNFLPLNSTTSIESFTPHLRTAYRKYVLPYLSVELATKVESHWQKGDLPKAISNLLPYVQEPIAHFAFVLALPTLQVQVSDAGIHRVEDSNQLTAYKYQVEALTLHHTEQAWYAIDELLKFLEKNEKEYPEWATSESSVILRSNFIQTATEFEQFADIQQNRRLFYSLKPTMKRVEETFVFAALGDTLYKALKEECAKDRIVSRMEGLLKFIKPAVALLTLANASTDLVLQWYGNNLMPTSFSAEKESKKIELQKELLQTWKNEKENQGMRYISNLKKHILIYYNQYPEYPLQTEKIKNDGSIFTF